MLLYKIEKIEVRSISYFSLILKITSVNGEVDDIEVDILPCSHSLVRIADKNIKSYRLIGENLSNKVEKLTGPLAGGVFYLDELGACFYRSYELEVDECDCYMNGDEYSYRIIISNFVIKIILNSDITKEPSIEIFNSVDQPLNTEE